jgi:outer membrane protein OmpA-like peptidoglycan-associated protein
MKPSYYLLSFLLIVPVLWCSAQQPVLDRSKLPKVYVYYDFLNDNEDWKTFDHQKARAYDKDGKHYLLSKQKEISYQIYNKYNMDPDRNYYIEMEFAKISGPENYGSGLIFNKSSTKARNEYVFEISPNQNFCIYEWQNGVYNIVQVWKKCDYINKNTTNRLGIWAKGGIIYFYINDKLVHQIKCPPFLGPQIGFSVARDTEIAVDKFQIFYIPSSESMNLIENAVNGYKKVPLDSNINSAGDDLFPIISADGKLMFFVRATNLGSIGIDSRHLFYSEYNDNTKTWSPALPLPGTINQGGRPQVMYISPDKNTIFINATYENGKYIKDEGISVSNRVGKDWSPPEKIEIEEWENFSRYESYVFATGGKVMLLSIYVPGGFGQRDIYVSFCKGDKWSKPKNIGSVVNTFLDDHVSCLAPDNVTLYYSTAAKPGYGKEDIFVTRRLDDTWLNWSEPKNIGPDINTNGEDNSLVVDAFGEYAYFGDGRKKEPGDIVKIQIPESARPKPVVIVKGKIFDKYTNEPISASIRYEDLDLKKEVGTALSNNEDGSYILVLPYGVNYDLVATKKGYLTESKIIDLKDTIKRGFIEMNIDLYVMPIKTGNSLTLNAVFFEPDKFDLTENSFMELNRLYDIMLENGELIVEIEGHTDYGNVTSSEQELITLSLNRAIAVKEYLVSKGISAVRITTVGYGRSRPVVKGNNPANRRVEVRVVKL